jgi:hypothetical protein
MEVTGKIKKIDETKSYGASGFRKREVVLTTDEQYPQMILVEFIQDKCDLLDNFNLEDEVKISINLKGREWINPEGVAKYFNSIQGWRIEKIQVKDANQIAPIEAIDAFEAADSDSSSFNEEPDDLPF